MHCYNADGSIGEMCGNGARCIARYGYEKGLSSEVEYECSYVELGNPGLPHGVVKYDNIKDVSSKEIWDLGSKYLKTHNYVCNEMSYIYIYLFLSKKYTQHELNLVG